MGVQVAMERLARQRQPGPVRGARAWPCALAPIDRRRSCIRSTSRPRKARPRSAPQASTSRRLRSRRRAALRTHAARLRNDPVFAGVAWLVHVPTLKLGTTGIRPKLTCRRTECPVLFRSGGRFGAPDRMKLGTLMSLFPRSNLDDDPSGSVWACPASSFVRLTLVDGWPSSVTFHWRIRPYFACAPTGPAPSGMTA